MSTTLITDLKKLNRSLSVEQSEPDYITIRKKLKDSEYAVEILVFKKEDIDELLKIQTELYSIGIEKKALIERLLNILKKIGIKNN